MPDCIWTTPAHYRLCRSDGGIYPWPAVGTPRRRTFVSAETTLTRMETGHYMAHENGSIRARILIPDHHVVMTREKNGSIE